jgi:hypothetical protein
MASRHPLKKHDARTWDSLERALRDVWQVLKAHDPYLHWDSDFQLELAETLMELADSGVTEPQEVRNILRESFDLKPSH